MSYSQSAISVGAQKRTKAPKKKIAKGDRNIPFDRWDTNKDNILSLEEYFSGPKGKNLETRFKKFEKNNGGKVTRQEFVNLSAK